MKGKCLIFSMLLVVIMLFVSNSVQAVDWRFPVGLTYVSNFQNIADLYEDNLKAEGLITETVDAIPVALSFNPYVQFNSGLGVGAGVGPLMIITGDTSFVDLPLKLDLRYSIPQINVSPYVRGGLSYHAASGDYVESSNPGVFGAIGVEFLRKKVVGFGFELSYDSSEIEFEREFPSGSYSTIEKIKPCEFTASLYAVF
jgi:hypothetical protein